jgi:putative Ca2+/H+ antiporter (TMEM165/GDT1 family)
MREGEPLTLEPYLNPLLVSAGVVALAEIGDKTQLLAIVLAARFKRPLPIVLAILLATLLNHGLAGYFGTWLSALFNPDGFRYLLGTSFIAMAGWVLIPDKVGDKDKAMTDAAGVFGTSFLSFFMAEMGDKTQIATLAMAAHYASPATVVIGSTLGMLIANVPAVYLGEQLAGKIPMRLVHGLAAIIFATIGLGILLELDVHWQTPAKEPGQTTGINQAPP